MSDSTGTRRTPVLNQSGEVDEEWIAYWQEIREHTIIFCALVMMDAMMNAFSGYPKEIRDQIRDEIHQLVKRYDIRQREESEHEQREEGPFSYLFR